MGWKWDVYVYLTHFCLAHRYTNLVSVTYMQCWAEMTNSQRHLCTNSSGSSMEINRFLQLLSVNKDVTLEKKENNF